MPTDPGFDTQCAATVGNVLPDALRDALGEVLAEQRRQWQRERELIGAQAQRL